MQEFEHNYYFTTKVEPVFAVDVNYPFSQEFNIKQKQALKRTTQQIRDEIFRLLYHNIEEQKDSKTS